MDLLQISKEIKLSGKGSMVPNKNLFITYSEYINVVQGGCWSNRIESYLVDGEKLRYVVSNWMVGEKKLFSLTYDEG